MSSGSLTIGDVLIVGSEGSTATFSQSSGSVRMGSCTRNSYNLGRQAGTKGTYTQSSGSVNVAGDGFIGQEGEGIYNQTSGSVTRSPAR